MGGIVSALFGGAKPQGPSAAEKALQQQQAERAAEERAEADRLAALATKASSRRKALSYQDDRRAATLAG